MNNAHNVNQVHACHTQIGQIIGKRESENKFWNKEKEERKDSKLKTDSVNTLEEQKVT